MQGKVNISSQNCTNYFVTKRLTSQCFSHMVPLFQKRDSSSLVLTCKYSSK